MEYDTMVGLVVLGTVGFFALGCALCYAYHVIVDRMNWIGVKDNAQHIAGLIIGTYTKTVQCKSMRSTKWYSTVAVTMAQNGIYHWFPYKMIKV